MGAGGVTKTFQFGFDLKPLKQAYSMASDCDEIFSQMIQTLGKFSTDEEISQIKNLMNAIYHLQQEWQKVGVESRNAVNAGLGVEMEQEINRMKNSLSQIVVAFQKIEGVVTRIGYSDIANGLWGGNGEVPILASTFQYVDELDARISEVGMNLQEVFGGGKTKNLGIDVKDLTSQFDLSIDELNQYRDEFESFLSTLKDYNTLTGGRAERNGVFSFGDLSDVEKAYNTIDSTIKEMDKLGIKTTSEMNLRTTTIDTIKAKLESIDDIAKRITNGKYLDVQSLVSSGDAQEIANVTEQIKKYITTFQEAKSVTENRSDLFPSQSTSGKKIKNDASYYSSLADDKISQLTRYQEILESTTNETADFTKIIEAINKIGVSFDNASNKVDELSERFTAFGESAGSAVASITAKLEEMVSMIETFKSGDLQKGYEITAAPLSDASEQSLDAVESKLASSASSAVGGIARNTEAILAEANAAERAVQIKSELISVEAQLGNAAQNAAEGIHQTESALSELSSKDITNVSNQIKGIYEANSGKTASNKLKNTIRNGVSEIADIYSQQIVTDDDMSRAESAGERIAMALVEGSKKYISSDSTLRDAIKQLFDSGIAVPDNLKTDVANGLGLEKWSDVIKKFKGTIKFSDTGTPLDDLSGLFTWIDESKNLADQFVDVVNMWSEVKTKAQFTGDLLGDDNQIRAVEEYTSTIMKLVKQAATANENVALMDAESGLTGNMNNVTKGANESAAAIKAEGAAAKEASKNKNALGDSEDGSARGMEKVTSAANESTEAIDELGSALGRVEKRKIDTNGEITKIAETITNGTRSGTITKIFDEENQLAAQSTSNTINYLTEASDAQKVWFNNWKQMVKQMEIMQTNDPNSDAFKDAQKQIDVLEEKGVNLKKTLDSARKALSGEGQQALDKELDTLMFEVDSAHSTWSARQSDVANAKAAAEWTAKQNTAQKELNQSVSEYISKANKKWEKQQELLRTDDSKYPDKVSTLANEIAELDTELVGMADDINNRLNGVDKETRTAVENRLTKFRESINDEWKIFNEMLNVKSSDQAIKNIDKKYSEMKKAEDEIQKLTVENLNPNIDSRTSTNNSRRIDDLRNEQAELNSEISKTESLWKLDAQQVKENSDAYKSYADSVQKTQKAIDDTNAKNEEAERKAKVAEQAKNQAAAEKQRASAVEEVNKKYTALANSIEKTNSLNGKIADDRNTSADTDKYLVQWQQEIDLQKKLREEIAKTKAEYNILDDETPNIAEVYAADNNSGADVALTEKANKIREVNELYKQLYTYAKEVNQKMSENVKSSTTDSKREENAARVKELINLEAELEAQIESTEAAYGIQNDTFSYKAKYESEQTKSWGVDDTLNKNAIAEANANYDKQIKLLEKINSLKKSQIGKSEKDTSYKDAAKQIEEYSAQLKTLKENTDAFVKDRGIENNTYTKRNEYLEKEIELSKELERAKSNYNSKNVIGTEDEIEASIKKIDQLKQKIRELQSKYSGAAGTESYSAFSEYAKQLDELETKVMGGSTTNKEFASSLSSIRAGIEKTTSELKTSGKAYSSFFTQLKSIGSAVSSYFSVYNLVFAAISSIRNAVTSAVDLQDSLVDLQIVTGQSTDELYEYAGSLSKTAQEIGSSMEDLITATTTYARLGYSIDESNSLAKYTAMLEKVGDIDASDAQDAITAILQAYPDDASISNIESVMDKLVTVGNNFPISVSQIAEGMNNASSSLAAAGNSYEQSIALLAASNATIQDASKASTALRTITARLRNTTTDLEELGETDFTESKYNELVESLTAHNVALVDANNEYRSTYDIMKDIAAQWDNMSSMEQAALADAVAGTRQQAVFYSMIENFDIAEDAVDAMNNSAGALNDAYSVYLDSITAHLESLKAAFNGLSTNVANDLTSMVNDVLDFATNIINNVDNVVDALGGLKSVIEVIVEVLGAKALSNAIPLLIDGIGNIFGKISKLIGLFTVGNATSGIIGGINGVLSAINPLTFGITALTTAAVGITVYINKMREAEQAEIEVLNKSNSSAKETSDNIHDLYIAYADAARNIDETEESQGRLTSTASALTGALEDQGVAVNNLTGNYKNLAKAQLEEQKSIAKQNKDSYEKKLEDYGDYLRQIGLYSKYIEDKDSSGDFSVDEILDFYDRLPGVLNDLDTGSALENLTNGYNALSNIKDNLEPLVEGYRESASIISDISSQIADVDRGYEKTGSTIANYFGQIFSASYTNGFTDLDSAIDSTEEKLEELENEEGVLSNLEISGGMQSELQGVQAEIDTTKEKLEELNDIKLNNPLASDKDANLLISTLTSALDMLKDEEGLITESAIYSAANAYEFETSSRGIISEEELSSEAQAYSMVTGVAKHYGITVTELIGILQTYGAVEKSVSTVLSDMTESFNAAKTSRSALDDAIAEQGSTGTLTLETYEALIDASEDYASCIEYENGTIQINTEKANELCEANNDLTIAQIELQKAQAKARYKNLSEQIAALEDNEENLTEAEENQLAKLQDEADQVSAAINKYEIMRAELIALSSAYSKWQNAQNQESSDAMYNDMNDAYQDIRDALESGQVGKGNVKYTAAVDLLIPDDYKDDIDAVGEYAGAVLARYLTEDTAEGAQNFVQDLIDNGFGEEGSTLADFVLKDGTTIEDICDGLKITPEMAKAIFSNLEMYPFDFEWTDEDFDLVAAEDEVEALLNSFENLKSELSSSSELNLDTKYEMYLEQLAEIEAKLHELDGADMTVEANQASLQAAQKQLDDLVAAAEADDIELDVTLSDSDVDSDSITGQLDAIVQKEDEISEKAGALVSKNIGTLGASAASRALSLVMGQLNSIDAKQIKDKTYTITTKLRTVFEGVGAAAKASGGAAAGGMTLTGELGRELVVSDDRFYTVGDAGAELVNLKPGDIVFNHEDTEKILHGEPGARGTALASGNAAANISGGGGFIKTVAVSTSGPSDGGASSSSDDTWFEKEYKEHQHLVAMDQELESDYLSWLNDAYQRAYNEGIIELDDYYKYQEEAFDGARDLFDDYLNDSEFQIGLLEREEGTTEQIEEYYRKLIDDIQSQLNDAYSYGLDENSDYVQELIEKQNDYYDEISDMEEQAIEDARDAFDDYLNDNEFQIKLLEREEGNAEKIESIYTQLISDVQQKLDEAYASGLDQNDDYVQDLIDKMNDYKDEIEDLRQDLIDDARDAFDDYLNDSEFDIELLEREEDTADQVKEIYNKLIDDIQVKLDEAYASGLDKTDDYVQELIRKQNTYADAVSDIDEEAVQDVRDAFDDYLNDNEFQIELLQREEGNSKKIEDIYYQLISDIQEKLDEAYADGLTQDDDYVQELIRKQNDYYDAIKEARDDADDGAKDAIDDLVSYRMKMIEKDCSNQKEALNEQLSDLKDFIDKQKELLQDEADEEDYLEQQAEYRKTVSDLEFQLSQIQYDDSAWAQKRRLELQEDLADAKKDLEDFEKDNALDKALEALDDSYDAAEDAIDKQTDKIDEYLDNEENIYLDALADIQNSSIELYEQMIAYEKKYGEGVADNVVETWNDAYDALKEYYDLNMTLYKDVNLLDATGEHGGGRIADNGYASGTNSATRGMHKVFENGDEYIFSSSDGNKYKMFSGGEKVLDAQATKFLYNFANAGSTAMRSLLESAAESASRIGGEGNSQMNTITMGNIVINGSATEATVSELRRAQRESVNEMLKKLSNLK